MLRTAGVFLVGVGKTVGKVDREYEGEDKTGAPRGKLADRVFIPSMRDLRRAFSLKTSIEDPSKVLIESDHRAR